MEFETIRSAFAKHFDEMVDKYPVIYKTDTPPDELWETYLESIPAEENQIFRMRREYDCSTCRHTIKAIGGLVGIKDQEIETVWDFRTGDPDWDAVVTALAAFVRVHRVSDRFLSKEKNIGTLWNVDNKEAIRWTHFSVVLPDKFVYSGYKTIDTEIGNFRDVRNVFKRSLDEISLDAVDTVQELIGQGSLYRGEQYQSALRAFRACLVKYADMSHEKKELYAWEHAHSQSDTAVSKIRNTAIGTLLVNISEGMDLDAAVRQYESITAPENYKRSKPIFTNRMLEEAQKKITDLGYLDSLQRRFATADDITVNNILFSNRDTAKRIQGGESIFDSMKKDAKGASDPRKFSKVEEVPVKDFIEKVLPTATDVEAFVEGRHAPNFVSLIAPKVPESKGMFKWGNNFGWAYSGNLTDSALKTNVKNAGGKVDGVLRFSIQWNDLDDYDQNDEDAHCIEPKGYHIYYGNRVDYRTGGNLDVDIIHPVQGKPAVENITWPDLRKMPDGAYKFYVHCYSGRGGKSGFRAEIEFSGELYSFNYKNPLRTGQDVEVAHVVKCGNEFTIFPAMEYGTASREVWSVSTNTFVPVSVICYSPNYWDEQKGIGNKHYMFMLKGCVNPEQPAAWYNEFLNSDLYPEHRKVMEAMGVKAHVDDADDQLSGLGFSSTVRNDLVVKVKGKTDRIMKIKF